ncbi:tyrosine-protein phosphatase [Paracidobacterium acidisoli]|uniref:protein-tyrosine-phosphatase n=1 Tax=Paracidobacterium acidisoli TaxID=2303751 RepID=A0A372IKF2_9BACT|nr:CpsB/CapC family capsule biosynthesis tyrosine phosphatase [Paracidobacterium acidisoli]MBT9332736.1 exopolysaccharide biosynthesis protein [Paracidobacterium acidisoli]
MIDIHHHLLFGLDDGAPDLETSVAMVDAAAADGITHIVCTPHSNEHFRFDPEANQQRLAAIRERIGDKVTLGLGCDFHLSWDNIEDALRHPAKYSINGGQYLLVEFAELMIPASIGDSFYELSVKGLRSIITHPERNPIIQRHPERLAGWLRDGCLVQITASSLNGRFGRTAQSFAFECLEKNWVHFLATDAHNVKGRPPQMREAWETVAKRYGQATADRLCIGNPRAAFNNAEWPAQPDPEGIFDNEPDPAQKRRPGFLNRLFTK